MGVEIYHVDAFTEKPFGGNPAAVCLLKQSADETWMQNVARNMNLSETAFVLPRDKEFNLRWFTPQTEVNLCGHATLASAHVLRESGVLKRDEQVRFQSRSGVLTAQSRGDLIELDFPASYEESATASPELLAALGVEPVYVGMTGQKYLIELDSEERVRKMAPDFQAMSALPGRSVMVTSAASSAEFDFVSRYFAPWIGIDEDPVTGSAHCCLGPYWAKRLGKDSLRAYQASARGGIVHVRVAGDRIVLGGNAVTVLRGTLMV